MVLGLLLTDIYWFYYYLTRCPHFNGKNSLYLASIYTYLFCWDLVQADIQLGTYFAWDEYVYVLFMIFLNITYLGNFLN